MTNNTWTRNTADSNGTYGFLLGTWGSQCAGNLIGWNTAHANGTFDGSDMNAAGLNTWTGNTFGTTRFA